MEYLYLYIWKGMASFYYYFNKILSPLREFTWRIQNFDDKRKKDWKGNFNKGMYGFGGLSDWFAFGILIAVLLIPVIILIVYIDGLSNFFNSKARLYVLFIGIAAFCYYWIYIKNVVWLKDRISKEGKKYYMK